MTSGELFPTLVQAQSPDTPRASEQTTDHAVTEKQTRNDRLTPYAEQLVQILRAERARLAVWDRRLSAEQASLQKAQDERNAPAPTSKADQERVAVLPREIEAAKVRQDTLMKEVEALKTFLSRYKEQKHLTVQLDSLDVQVVVQWSKASLILRDSPSNTSATIMTIPQNQPVVVIATVRDTTWRLVSAAGHYGFVSSKELRSQSEGSKKP